MRKTRLTKRMVDTYVDGCGGGCPFCGEDAQIEGGHVEITGGGANQEIGCLECGAHWYDLYTLTGAELLCPPEKKRRRT